MNMEESRTSSGARWQAHAGGRRPGKRFSDPDRAPPGETEAQVPPELAAPPPPSWPRVFPGL